MILERALAAAGDEDHLLDPRLARFLDRILDQRPVDDRSASPWGSPWWRAGSGCRARRPGRRPCGRVSFAPGFGRVGGRRLAPRARTVRLGGVDVGRRQVEAVVRAAPRSGVSGSSTRSGRAIGGGTAAFPRWSAPGAASAGRRRQRLARRPARSGSRRPQPASSERRRPAQSSALPHSFIPSAFFAASIRARTASGAVPP